MNMNSLRVALADKSVRIGLIMVVVAVLASGALFTKDRIGTLMMGGSTVDVHFDGGYKLRAHVSQVKVAYVVVGKVTGVDQTDDGAVVHLKVQDDVLDTLGSEPTATIRATTLLGGNYFVDLEPGGAPGEFDADSIPASRTDVPVELDKVARSLQPEARRGVQATVEQLDRTLDAEGRTAMRRLLEAAPAALAPAPGVLSAAQGERSERDLAALVSGLESTGRTLSERDGELAAILDDLATTSSVLGRRAPEVSAAIGDLPDALRSTETGLADLSGTLSALEDVSAETRPLVRRLDNTLRTAKPLIREARPLVRDGRRLMRDARPLVRQLTPTTVDAEQVLDDVEGKVLDRLNDKVAPMLHTRFHGKAPYANTVSEKPLYEEVAYMAAVAARAAAMTDRNGNALSIQAGVGLETLGSFGGIPVSLSQLHQVLMESVDPEALGLPTLNRLLGQTGGGR